MIARRQLIHGAMALGATLATGCGARSVATAPDRTATPASGRTTARRRRIGHTGITWGYATDAAPTAIRDVGALGYHGFESFGSVLEHWQARGGLHDALAAQRLDLVGAYCPLVLTDAARRAAEVEKALRWGRLIRDHGGRIAVIGPDNVERRSFDFAARRADIIAALDAIGRALADIGVTAAVHQHTGSCITTRGETWSIMENVDHRVVKLCPDTGELLAAGIDPVEAIRHFGAIVAHVHIKDYDGGSRHDGYTPVGAGQVPLGAVMEVLESLPGDFMVMAELNPDPSSNQADPATPRRAALQSRRAFEALGYAFRTGAG